MLRFGISSLLFALSKSNKIGPKRHRQCNGVVTNVNREKEGGRFLSSLSSPHPSFTVPSPYLFYSRFIFAFLPLTSFKIRMCQRMSCCTKRSFKIRSMLRRSPAYTVAGPGKCLSLCCSTFSACRVPKSAFVQTRKQS